MNDLMNRRSGLLLLAFIASFGAGGASGCTTSGCPNGTEREGERCVPLECDGAAYFADADGDGFGDPASASCAPEQGYVTLGGDCDDASAALHPQAEDVCNGLDDNCDGYADEPFECADGYSEPCVTSCGSAGSQACLQGCVLADACVPPAEQCNGIDDDCDGNIDEGLIGIREGATIGALGDTTIGLVAAPSGYVAFLLRGTQIIAQPLDAQGFPSNEEIPMLEGSGPAIKFAFVAGNSTRAFVLYAEPTVLRLRAFDLGDLKFGASIALSERPGGFYTARLAANEQRVMALVIESSSEEKAYWVRALSVEADLSFVNGPHTLHTGPFTSSLFAYFPLSLAAPPDDGMPWVATYYREAFAENAATRMLVGLSAAGKVAVQARPLPGTATASASSAFSHDGGVTVTPGAPLVAQPFGASLAFDPSEAGTLESQSGLRLSVQRAFGRWVVAYDRTTDNTPQLVIGLFTDALARDTLFTA
ncbi:MAG: putative metal-binding motif-containing protein, partial [Polyangiaceae bacterium]|nr:putative metal-binding motif-containing protein [Polyangiaceae bacterium]